MIGRWLRRHLWCAHAHTIRARDAEGRYWLVCDCGHTVEAIRRTEAERTKASHFPTVRIPTAHRVTKPLSVVARRGFRRRP